MFIKPPVDVNKRLSDIDLSFFAVNCRTAIHWLKSCLYDISYQY